MTNQSTELANKPMIYEVNGEEVKLTANTVKNYLTSGNDKVTDQEVVMFMNLCKFQKLNPFLREAYLVKFKGAPAQIITSKEAYMKKAERAKGFDGFEAGIIVDRSGEIVEEEGAFKLASDKLLGGWCRAYKKDRSKPYTSKISLDEYNKGQSTWNKMPATMIRKTAIVQALREAFPEDLGALYTEEEAGQVHVDPEQEMRNEVKEKANKKTLKIDPVVEEAEIIDVEPEIVQENTNRKDPGF
jgi:phage recombination protein Bet